MISTSRGAGLPNPEPARGSPVPAADVWVQERSNPIHTIVFHLSLVLIFLRFSMLHETLTYTAGVNTRLLYVVSLPVFLGVLLTGGLQKALRHRVTWFWLAFSAWLLLSFPFSTWRGGSADVVSDWCRTMLPMVFVTGSLARNWRDCHKMLVAVALGAVCNLAVAYFFTVEVAGRAALKFGSVSNSNDIAGHLILVLPFLVYVAVAHKYLSLAIIPLLVYGLWVIVGSGSRGAFLSLIMCAVFSFFRARGGLRVALAGLLGFGLILPFFMPSTTRDRLISMFRSAPSDEGAPTEADLSRVLRTTLLAKTVEFSIRHPLLGVGPGQFTNYEGTVASKEEGRRGLWYGAHNAYTAISAESGIPALFFYLGAIFITYRTLSKTYTKVKAVPELRKIAVATFCVMLGMVGFLTAIFFLNFSYTFYLPALSGLAIVMSIGAEAELARLQRSAGGSSATLPVPAPSRRESAPIRTPRGVSGRMLKRLAVPPGGRRS